MLSGFQPTSVSHNSDLLEEVCRVLRPSGTVFIREPIAESSGGEGHLKTKEQLVSALKLSGFVDISQVRFVHVICNVRK